MLEGEAANDDVVMRAFPAPPPGFSPDDASAEKLSEFGFPPRPAEDADPSLLEHWRAIVALPVIDAKLEFAELSGPASSPETSAGIPSTWSGSVVFARQGELLRDVAAEWTVPNAAPPWGPNAVCHQWIGIDGAALSRRQAASMLRVGTTVEAPLVGDDAITYPWWEWKPLPAKMIVGIVVAPGDVIWMRIIVIGGNATIWVSIKARYRLPPFTVPSPAGGGVQGKSAEWIVEAPGWLPQYGRVYFDYGLAVNDRFEARGPGAGQLVAIRQRHANSDPNTYGQALMRVRHSWPSR